MSEYLSPAVYVEEVDTGSKPIEGVSTSTTGMVGITERGPVNVPILVTSFGEFKRWFGEYLTREHYQNNGVQHSYLPHAAEGFFTNRGQRLYVTRVLPAEAVRAHCWLFERPDDPRMETVLLRAAAAGTGDALNPPSLYVLNRGSLAANDWIRIGDGSQAEYRRVTDVGDPADPTESTHVALSEPPQMAHDAATPVEEYDGTVATDGGAALRFNPNGPVSEGEDVVVLRASDAAIVDAFVTAVNGGSGITGRPQLLQFTTDGPRHEYRLVVEEVTRIGGGVGVAVEVEVNLGRPLELSYDAADEVDVLAVTNPANLGLAANAGDRMLFVDDRDGEPNFRNAGNILVIDRNNANHGLAEVILIGELGELRVSVGAYRDYAIGTRVDQVELEREVIDLGTGDAEGNTIVLDDVTAFRVGEEVVVATTDGEENAMIATIDDTAGTIEFTADLDSDATLNETVRSAPRSLTAPAQAGDVVIHLDRRVGLEEEDVLAIGTDPNQEYVTILAIQGERSSVAPDAGNIVLAYPLGRNHANGTEVRRQHPPAAPVAADPAVARLILNTSEDADRLYYVDNGQAYAAGDLIRVTTTSGNVLFHRVADHDGVDPVEVEVNAALDRSHAVGSAAAQREDLLWVEALDAGVWGNRLRISVEESEDTRIVTNVRLEDLDGNDQIRLSSPLGVEGGTVLEILGPNPGDPPLSGPIRVSSVGPAPDYVVSLQDTLDGAAEAAVQAVLLGGQQPRVRSREFKLTAHLLRQPDPAVPSRNNMIIDTEAFNGLSMDPRHSRYVAKVIGDVAGDTRLWDRRPEGESKYIRVEDPGADEDRARLGPEALEDTLPSGQVQPARRNLRHGDDVMTMVTDDTYIGVNNDEPEDRTGLESLRNIESISLVACPGQTGVAVQRALIDHCENMRYRFAVLDGPPPPADTLTDVRAQRQNFDTKYAALYYPWLLIPDPFPPKPTEIADVPIPCGGHVLGIYARTDVERGVHKAPANEVVRGITGLQRRLNKREHDMLNPSPVNINAIRDFRPQNRGIRVWGGRVITSDTDWKYVNVRRLLIFIEHSIERGLQWVIFEPNSDPLWARVRRTISNFLAVVWRNGALEGTTVEEAFFVKCDRTTMTQTDIDSGRLICEVGVAPVKPAEFVIIRIGLWTAHADTE